MLLHVSLSSLVVSGLNQVVSNDFFPHFLFHFSHACLQLYHFSTFLRQLFQQFHKDNHSVYFYLIATGVREGSEFEHVISFVPHDAIVSKNHLANLQHWVWGVGVCEKSVISVVGHYHVDRWLCFFCDGCQGFDVLVENIDGFLTIRCKKFQFQQFLFCE